jgi:hypothetical protein
MHAHPSFHRMNYVKRNKTGFVSRKTTSLTDFANSTTVRAKSLDELLESAVDGRAQGLDVLVEVDGELGALGDALGGELELLVHLLVGAGSTEAVETELLVRVLLPSHCGHDLDGHCGDAVGDDGELVLLGLGVEYLPAGKGDNTSCEALLREGLDGLEAERDLGTGGDEGDIGTLLLKSNVSTLDTVLESRALELGEVLAGESHDGWCALGGKSHVVSSGGLVAVSGTPNHAVGQSAEVGESLDRLVSGAILTKTDGVVGSDVDQTLVGESGETDGTGGVGDEVEESSTSGDDGTVGGQTVHDGGHGVLTDTVPHVTARPVSNAEVGGLEVNSILPAGVVGASQIGGTGDELGNDIVDGLENGLGELPRRDGIVGRLVCGERLLPALRKVPGGAAGEVLVQVGELLGVLLEQLVPLLLSSSALGGVLVVHVVNLLGDDKGLLGVEAELLLDALDVVSLQGVAMDTTGTLELGAETNGGGQLDDGRLVLDLLGLLDGSLNARKIAVAVFDVLCVPAVGLEALHNILSEGALDVTV